MTWLANAVPLNPAPQPFSWRVFLTLLFVLLISAATFAELVRRWTTHRHRVVLSDWAKGRGFRIVSPESAPALPQNHKTPLRIVRAISDDSTWLLEVESDVASAPHAHVLLRKIDREWKPTGLRPAHATRSLLDLFSMSSYLSLGNVERFVVYGTDTKAAVTLSKSQIGGLLPRDVGLLLHETWVLLDFSDRNFDPIEFDRMTALMEQLIPHLPM
jgi:hypothetical protein